MLTPPISHQGSLTDNAPGRIDLILLILLGPALLPGLVSFLPYDFHIATLQ